MKVMRKNEIVIILSMVFLIFFILVAIFILYVQKNSDTTVVVVNDAANESSKSITKNNLIKINNFADYEKNIDEDERSRLESILTATVLKNIPRQKTLDVNNINDAFIREGTYRQNYEKEKLTYSTFFIVDIASLKQTYRVYDVYSTLPREISGILDYSAVVVCPEKQDLIYGEFDCTDRLREEKARNQ